MNAYPLLEMDPEVLCSRSCSQVASVCVETGETIAGEDYGELVCFDCWAALESAA